MRGQTASPSASLLWTKSLAVRLFSALLLLGLYSALSGCAVNEISLSPASNNEKVPFPSFIAADISKQDQWPSYSEVRVYDHTDGCTVPNCPIMWQAIVSETRSPRSITYGSLPSFGAMTIVSAKELRPSHKYTLMIGKAENTNPNGQGTGIIQFAVDDKGLVTID